MKDYVKQLISPSPTSLAKRNVAREYLQARTLQALQREGAFSNWLFHGGTALRFLYMIPRYSEDLDFSVLDVSQDSRFRPAVKAVQRTFESESYKVAIRINDKTAVQSASIRFQELLYEIGLSPHQSENLSIKLEVDTNPPEGAGWETTLMRRYVALNLPHHDKPSLLAGKVHAVLARPYTKGRDLYDLIWYLSDRSWPGPNLSYLNAALAQTGWDGTRLNERNWRQVLLKKLQLLDWENAVRDVAPFLEEPGETELITLNNCVRLLRA